jgi:hypothetical protein
MSKYILTIDDLEQRLAQLPISTEDAVEIRRFAQSLKNLYHSTQKRLDKANQLLGEYMLEELLMEEKDV